MAAATPDEGSLARAALERSLTLNKKQSWFGSIKNVVHQGALTAKAAMESLRGGALANSNNRYVFAVICCCRHLLRNEQRIIRSRVNWGHPEKH